MLKNAIGRERVVKTIIDFSIIFPRYGLLCSIFCEMTGFSELAKYAAINSTTSKIL